MEIRIFGCSIRDEACSNRLTSDAALDFFPIWSPDGSRIVFSSSRKKAPSISTRSPPTGAGRVGTALARRATNKVAIGFVARTAASAVSEPRRKDEQGPLDIAGMPWRSGHPFPVTQTEFDEREGQFSPDGKWVAYQSNESGPFESMSNLSLAPGASREFPPMAARKCAGGATARSSSTSRRTAD